MEDLTSQPQRMNVSGHAWQMQDRTITVALTAKATTYPERFRWALEHGFALEYTPMSDSLGDVKSHTTMFLEAGVPVRYHAFFPGHEIAHKRPDIAEEAVRVHKEMLKAMQRWGEQVVTVHIGLRPDDPLDSQRAVASLSELVAFARGLEITVCLENLRHGPTSDPDCLLAWARESGAAITVDVGHVISCEKVMRGDITLTDFVRACSDRLVEAHVYGREIDRHYPIETLEQAKSIVAALLQTNCPWWTIELEDYKEALRTRRFLDACVQAAS